MKVVGLAAHMLNFLNIDKGMKLILAQRSHNSLSQKESPILHGMVKIGSFNSDGSFPWTNWLHSWG